LNLINNISKNLIEFRNKYNPIKQESLKKMALQLLNNCINGSSSETVRPPVLTGLLRASGKYEIEGDTIWVGFDTVYAARQHENLTPAGDFDLGVRSQQAGNVGGKFLEKHLYNPQEIQEIMNIFGEKLQEDLFR
jgi:hypothetical protein